MGSLRETGRGRPLVLLHGWTCHGGYFHPQFEGLADRFHLMAPDLPGHGTAMDAPELTIEAAADSVADLLTKRNLENVILVGWSMGAIVAWSLLQRFGQKRIAGLVTIDMTAKVLNDEDWSLGTTDGLTAERNARVVTSMPLEWPRFARHISRTIFAEGAPETERNDWVRREIEKNDPVAMASMWQSLVSQDYRAFQKTMTLPTLLLHGAESQIYTKDVGVWQRDTLPNAELVLMEGTGHAPHMERPDLFNEALATFCRCL